MDLKVTIVSHEFPPYTFGGIAAHAHDLANALSYNGVSTVVVCGRSKQLTCKHMNSNLEVVRFPFINVPSRALWFQLQNYKLLTRFLRGCDVVHSISCNGTLICGYAKLYMHKPWLVSFHGIPLKNLSVFLKAPLSEWSIGDMGLHLLEYPLWEAFMRTEVALSDHIVSMGRSMLEDMLRIYDLSSYSVIPNGVDFKKIKGTIVNNTGILRPMCRKLRIFFCGRLYWRKGILHLIKAMERVVKEENDVFLQVFGRGPLESRLRSFINANSMKAYVCLRGWVPYGELLREMNNSDIVVLPSLYEVGPFVAALEAMALKKPLIVFDFPFTREFLMHMKTAVLVKAGSISGLSEAILMLVGDSGLRRKLGQSAYTFIVNHHDWRKLAKKYIHVYESMVAENSLQN